MIRRLIGHISLAFHVVACLLLSSLLLTGPINTSYSPGHCTLYCELHGCLYQQTTTALYQHFYPLVKNQTAWLHQLPCSYETANIFCYGLLAPCWLLSCLALIAYDPNRPAGPATKWRWLGLVLLVSLALWIPLYQLVFLAACQLCVYLASTTGLALYDFYILVFGLGIPCLLALATAVALVRLLCLPVLTARQTRPVA